jgi:2-keto-3-deoxy-L-fuconate dehydrogenase
MDRLKGKVALISGGARGQGAAEARLFVNEGAKVVVGDVLDDQAASLAREINGTSHSVVAVHLDVTRGTDWRNAVATCEREFGGLDILVNNAGIGHVGSIETTEPEDFDRLINVNVRGVYLVTRAFLPLLLATSPHREATGTIVNIASVSGLVGIKQRFAYCTTKGAVIAMTRQLAVEYPKALRVNAVCPGTVQTPFVEGYLEKFHNGNKEEVRAELRARQPVGRLGRPEEVAAAVRYLASDEAAFVTGSLLTLDGGWTAA